MTKKKKQGAKSFTLGRKEGTSVKPYFYAGKDKKCQKKKSTNCRGCILYR